jgi:hypothetical protein
LIFVAVKDCLMAEFGLGNEPSCDVNLPWNNRVNNKAGGYDDAVRFVDFWPSKTAGRWREFGLGTCMQLPSEQSCQKLVIFQIIKNEFLSFAKSSSGAVERQIVEMTACSMRRIDH